MRLVIDRPRICGRAGPRGHAGDDGVKMLSVKTVTSERGGITDIAEAYRRSSEQPHTVVRRQNAARARARANEANHFITTLDESTHGCATDSPGRSGHKNSMGFQRRLHDDF
jgi:hypothetical protein